jgi:hypothetical protein
VNAIQTGAIDILGSPDQTYDWKSSPSKMCDGGTLAWGVLFDLESRCFSEFHFNGGP